MYTSMSTKVVYAMNVVIKEGGRREGGGREERKGRDLMETKFYDQFRCKYSGTLLTLNVKFKAKLRRY